VPAEFSEEAYQRGFDAGYRAGQLVAEAELNAQSKVASDKISQLLSVVERLRDELGEVVISHLPQLLQIALMRVMEHHKFTTEEIQNEVESILKELALAKKIEIQCFEGDLKLLQEHMAKIGTSLTQAAIIWTVNKDLRAGEFILESDLGVFDGRRLTRAAQVQVALKDL
jgi:flagellar biosynthesis/type III secretory pathway protein FliH